MYQPIRLQGTFLALLRDIERLHVALMSWYRRDVVLSSIVNFVELSVYESSSP